MLWCLVACIIFRIQKSRSHYVNVFKIINFHLFISCSPLQRKVRDRYGSCITHSGCQWGQKGGSTRTESISTFGWHQCAFEWLWVNCKQLLCVSRKYTSSWTTGTQSCIDECPTSALVSSPMSTDEAIDLKRNLLQMEYQEVNESIRFIALSLDKGVICGYQDQRECTAYAFN